MINEFTLIFHSPYETPKKAGARFLSLREEIKKAHGEIVGTGLSGEYKIKGTLSRWKLIQIAEREGFILDRIYMLTG
jgi:hypothetical protein